MAVFFSLVSDVSLAAVSPFSPTRFESLQNAGRPILVVVHADWCPTCKAQSRVLKELLVSQRYKNVDVLRVDFDTDTAALARFRVNAQSTLIAFAGKKELGRSTGATSRDGIAAVLNLTSPE